MPSESALVTRASRRGALTALHFHLKLFAEYGALIAYRIVLIAPNPNVCTKKKEKNGRRWFSGVIFPEIIIKNQSCDMRSVFAERCVSA